MHDPNYPPELVAAIRAAYEGEIYGAAWFGALAHGPWPHDAQHKLADLEKLERAVEQRLAPLAMRLGIAADREAQEAKGRGLAEQTARMSWNEFMNWLRPRLAHYVAIYDRLAIEGEPAAAGALAMLARHERALLHFCESELEGRAGESMQQVHAILESLTSGT